jgi:peptide/nickel transport system substrate-binding protein
MKRFFVVLVLLLLMLDAAALRAAGQDGPTGTWLGTWPYTPPASHHLNSFAPGGLNDNLGLVYRPLVELTPAYYLWASDTYVPILAVSWGFVDDNTAYEYTIKEGAMWSNGDPITAQDVVHTFAIGRILGWSHYDFLENVMAVDTRTVRFNFKSGMASRSAERLILKEYVVASANYGALATQAMELYASGSTPDDASWHALVTTIDNHRPDTLIASGPYTYALSDVGEAFMMLHWQPQSLYADSVRFGELKLWRGETEATTPLVLSGEIAHSTDVYAPATIEAFAAAGIRLVTTPRGYGPALLFNFKLPAFQQLQVRQAVAHAINRDQSALMTNGAGASGTFYMSSILDSMTPILLSQAGIAALNGYAYDPAVAATLMEAAGYHRNDDGKWVDADGNLLSFTCTFPLDFVDFNAAAHNAAAQLNAFGFDISERALPWQEADQAIREGDYDLSVWSWGAGSPFALQHMNNPIRRWNQPVLPPEQPGMGLMLQFLYQGEMIDLNDLIRTVSNGLDPAVLKTQADQVAKILNDEMFYLPLNEMLSIEPLNETFIGGAPADGDPIYVNPSNDHFIIYLILHGTLLPVGP